MRRRKPLNKRRISKEEDSGDDVPLIRFESKAAKKCDSNHFDALLQYEIMSCDFCDRKFNNRYKQIIHNAKHIIIPLIKHELHRCLECLFYFTSYNALTSHEDSQHPKKKIKFTNRFVFEDDVISDDEMENRDDENILNLFMNDCQVKLDSCSFRVVENSGTDAEVAERDETTLNGFYDRSDEGNYECVDYSVLIKPGFFRCKYCGKAFTNRYELICHNVIHMKMQKSRSHLCCHCDRYFVNGASLTHHTETAHNAKRIVHMHKSSCPKCGAVYHSLRRHYEVHHRLSCFKCKKDFDDEQTMAVHSIQHFETATPQVCSKEVTKLCLDDHLKKHSLLMRVCDFCETFSKNLSMYSYRHLEKIDASSGYSKCDQCTLVFPSLNLVEKVWKVNGSMANMVRFRKARGAKRVVTNEMRLKNIQSRMKIMNKIRKF